MPLSSTRDDTESSCKEKFENSRLRPRSMSPGMVRMLMSLEGFSEEGTVMRVRDRKRLMLTFEHVGHALHDEQSVGEITN